VIFDVEAKVLGVFLRRLSESLTDRTQAHILHALKLAVVRMQAAAATYGTALDRHRNS